MNAIDEAIAKAKARAAAKKAASGNVESESADESRKESTSKFTKGTVKNTEKSQLQVLKDERMAKLQANRNERNAKKEARKAEAEVRKAAVNLRKAARAEKKALLAAERAVKQSARKDNKYEKLFNKLPALDEVSQKLVNEAQAHLSAKDLLVVAEYLKLYSRIRSENAVSKDVQLEEGDTVRITTCSDTRMVGKVGVVSKVRKLRCLVDVPGYVRPAYVFLSDVEVVSEEDAEETEEEFAEAV